MKKLLCPILIFILSFLLISCGNKTSYTKEISYLPSYGGNVKLEGSASKNDKTGFTTATYVIENTSNKDVLNNYKKLLKDDGWTITQDLTPNSMAAKKDTHNISMIPKQDGNDVKLMIIAK